MIQILAEHSLTATGVIQAESMSVTEKERSPSASIVEEMTAEQRETGTWIQDGKGRVWRISRVEENPVTKTRTLTLEGILQTLKDRIIPTELDASGMGGNTNCTATQAIRAILKYQSDWTLGGCEFSDSNPYSFDGEDLLSALETVLGSLDDPWLETDVSRYPFRLYVRKASTTPQCEMRMLRNIVSMRRTVDTSGMFTRFYPIGKEDLRLSGNGYLEKNVSKYGLKEKMSTDQSRETEAELKSWASEQLRKHARPDVSISISGVDLSAATGEPMDHLILGTMCRVPLPEFGTTEKERIIQLSWPDEINRPEDVTVTLGNELADVSRIVKEEVTGSSSTAAKSSNASKKKAKEDHAWFVDTTDHVSMIAEAVGGEGASKDWSRVAEIKVDGKGIHQRVTETEGNIVTHEARIEATEKAIELEVNDRSKGDEELSGRIKVAADNIDIEVTRAKNEETQLRGALNVQADCVSLVTGVGDGKGLKYYATLNEFPKTGSSKYLYMAVDTGKYYSWNGSKYVETSPNAKIKAGGIVSAINSDGTSTTRILGTRVLVGGNLDADSLPDWCDTTEGLIAEKATILELNALSARVETLEADSITTKNLSAEISKLNGVTVKVLNVGSASDPTIALSSTSLTTKVLINAYGGIQDSNGNVYNVYNAAVSADGNTLTIYKLDGNHINFSKATTLSGAWSGGKYTVTASPQNVTHDVKVTYEANYNTGDATIGTVNVIHPSATGANWLRVWQQVGSLSGGKRTVKVFAGSTEVESAVISDYNTGYSAGSDAGWAAAYAKVSLPKTAQTSNAFMDVAVPDSTVGEQSTSRYTVSADNSYAYIKWGSTVVARVSNPGYNAGWAAAYAKVSLPKTAQTSNAFMDVVVPDSTVGEQSTSRYTVSADNDYAYIKWGSTVVAQVSNPGYSAGWAAAYGKVSLPKSRQVANAYITIKTPPSTVDGSAESTKYELTAGKQYAYIYQGSTIVARLEHNQYSTGYDDGYDDAYTPKYTEIDGGSVSWDSGDISGRKNIGAISRPDSHSYVKFSITIRGVTREFYITVN